MLKDYILRLTIIISLLGFNHSAIASSNSGSTSGSGSGSASGTSSGSSAATTIQPSVFQQTGAIIPILETGAQNYIQQQETSDINYGLHLINLDGSNITNPQGQFIADYSRLSCNSSTTESNLPECQGKPYATIRPSTIFSSLAYDDTTLATSGFLIRNIINPFPDPTLNTLLNSQSSASNSKNQAQIASLIAAQVPISMAKNSLNGIIARRYLDQNTQNNLSSNLPSGVTLPSGFTAKPLMQTMHDEALRRLTDPQWFSNLNTLTTSQLLIELLELEAFKVWVEYNKIEQNERIEALLATMLSSQSGQAGALSSLVTPDTKAQMDSSQQKTQDLQKNASPTISIPGQKGISIPSQ